jgi:hypothetical protein
MKYLLVVGFACDVYRQEPCARIFVANQFIDEFYIQYHKDTLRTAEKEFAQNTNILKPTSRFLFLKKNLPPLRFYEVEIDAKLDRLELRIEITNTDSNYTNGFITYSTLIKLQVCHFFPLHEKLLSRLKEIRNKNCTTQHYAWYRVYKNGIFDTLRNGMIWQGHNKQIFNSTLQSYDIGGNGFFSCQLIKKYGILMPLLIKSCRHDFSSPIIEYFINKYRQYENLRNSN